MSAYVLDHEGRAACLVDGATEIPDSRGQRPPTTVASAPQAPTVDVYQLGDVLALTAPLGSPGSRVVLAAGSTGYLVCDDDGGVELSVYHVGRDGGRVWAWPRRQAHLVCRPTAAELEELPAEVRKLLMWTRAGAAAHG